MNELIQLLKSHYTPIQASHCSYRLPMEFNYGVSCSGSGSLTPFLLFFSSEPLTSDIDGVIGRPGF